MKWPILAVVVLGLALMWWRHRRGADRQRRLMLLCLRAGLEFAPLDLAPDTAWLPFPIFGRSPSGTQNVVWDRRLGPSIRVFDHWYEELEDEGKAGNRRWLTCAVVPLPGSCPRLRVAPRDLSDEIRSALGMPEVRFESGRFDRRFVVESEDERFAFAFLEQRVMEGLLAIPEQVTAEVNDDVLLLSAPRLAPEQVLVLFDAAVQLHERIPRSLPSLYPPRPSRGPQEERWLKGRWSPDPTEGIGA